MTGNNIIIEHICMCVVVLVAGSKGTINEVKEAKSEARVNAKTGVLWSTKRPTDTFID
jgi:hypothetical protein